MKEHPILMSTDMVKAILDGIKTQTRRVMKLQPRKWITDDPEHPGWSWGGGTKKSDLLGTDVEGIKAWCPLFCPYGQVGDRLWCRETWRTNAIGGISYKADEGSSWIGKWKPSIHMFRKDSRITLEITEVRVERVQEITEGDAQAEGVTPFKWSSKKVSFTAAFAALWDSLNAKKYPWSSNPWVWCLSFKVV